MLDVTDATFEDLVVKRSSEVPVVVDLWAPWCGPCRTLGPILETVVADTDGKVELAKVNVDENPSISSAFRVQSIPAVFAVVDGRAVDSFIGALPEHQVRAWVEALVPQESDADRLVAVGDEASLRQALELEPGHEGAVVALAELLVARGDNDEALALLARVPETGEVRRVAALARVGVGLVGGIGAGGAGGAGDGEAAGGDGEAAGGAGEAIVAELDSLLDRVKGDDEARQRFLDLLEVLGPDDPRTASYRKALTARLF
ncbi:MAG: putative thioredoxin [Acidimicrobiaceae bacterium]|nr:putative thioredoxin [Acidimicrobiaceae bacterium]